MGRINTGNLLTPVLSKLVPGQIILVITSRVRPPNGGRMCDRNEANSPRHVVGCHLANNSIKSPTDHAIRKCAFSPNCWGTGGG